jgi:membrane protease subunit HflK
VQLVVLLLSTCVVFVDAGEQAVLEYFGKPVATLDAGAHFKLPWPVQKIYRFRTEQIQTFVVGYLPDEQSEKANTILWSVAHAKEENFLVGNRASTTVQTATAGTNDTLKAPPVSLISVSIPVQFQITNVMTWAFRNAGATNLLQSLATREVARFLAGVDLNSVMSSNRLEAAEMLRDAIQATANERQLGVKIVFVGLQDIHPPQPVAADYEKVVGAEQTKLATILAARAYAISNVAVAGAQAFTTNSLADAARLQLQVSRYAQAALFTNQIPAFAAAPSVYKQRMYFQTFADATRNARKYILLATNTTDVLIFDLEDKIRADLLNLSVPNE